MMRKQCRITQTDRDPRDGRAAAVMNVLEQPRQNGLPLAMVYPVEQPFADLYKPEEALQRGTLFKQLDMPFHKGFRI